MKASLFDCLMNPQLFVSRLAFFMLQTPKQAGCISPYTAELSDKFCPFVGLVSSDHPRLPASDWNDYPKIYKPSDETGVSCQAYTVR